MKAEDLGVDLSPRLETLKVVAPPTRQGGAKVRISLLLSRLGSGPDDYFPRLDPWMKSSRS